MAQMILNNSFLIHLFIDYGLLRLKPNVRAVFSIFSESLIFRLYKSYYNTLGTQKYQ